MRYLIILFSNFFFHFLEIIWTPKIFNIFWYCKILIFRMVKFKKNLNILNCLILKIREFLKLNNYSNFGKLSNFQKNLNLNFRNLLNWKINKFSEFFEFGKLSKFRKLANFGTAYPFDIPYYSQFCRFSYFHFHFHFLL